MGRPLFGDTTKYQVLEVISISSTDDILVDNVKCVAGSRSIVDDILLWCSDKDLVVEYFECVCRVFQKYRVSFKLSKCKFLSDCIEYVGHDLLSNGNTTVKSKFNMINDWDTPKSGQSLFSFIGLVSFYHRFAPYHEIRFKPLRRLLRRYYCQPIPPLAW